MSLIVEQSAGRPGSPALYLIHGWAMHGGLFAGLCDHLDGYEIARIDLPGHGANRERPWPDDPAELIDEVAELANDAWLVGWSLGGLIALMAALKDRWRPRGLALIAASPCFTRRDHWPHGVDDHLIEQMAAELEVAPERVLSRFFALEVQGSRSASADLRQLKAAALRYGPPAPDALSNGLDLLRGTDLSRKLGDIDLPVALIGGRRDRLIPWAALEATASALPRARLVAVPGAAHAPFLARPDAVAAAITELIETT